MNKADQAESDSACGTTPAADPCCMVCGSTGDGQQRQADFDTNLSSIRESASKGCRSCAFLLQGIQHYSGWWTSAIESEAEVSVLIQGGEVLLPRPEPDTIAKVYRCVGFYGSAGEISTYRAGNLVPRYSGDEACFDFIRACMANCEREHALCGFQSDQKLPVARLLDLSAEPFRLVPGAEVEEHYAALSHKWGTNASLSAQSWLVQDNLNQRSVQGVYLEELSKTFQDAVEICIRLSVRYLWIDSLCIVQDDLEDWAAQSTWMSSIYEGAHVVIAASRADADVDGIFHSRSQGHVLLDENGKATDTHVDIAYPHSDLYAGPERKDWPLLSRAWFFQERLFARRMVHFGPREIVYECRGGEHCECRGPIQNYSPYDAPASLQRFKDSLLSGSFGSLGLEWWQDLISEYANMSLTFETDRLPAISSTARRMAYPAIGDADPQMGRYTAGIFEHDLPCALLWMDFDFRPNKPSSRGFLKPSWSWISNNGPIRWQFVQRAKLTCTVEPVKLVLATSDIFGMVHSAELPLTAPCATSDISFDASTAEPRLAGMNPEAFVQDSSFAARFGSNDGASIEVTMAVVAELEGSGADESDLPQDSQRCGLVLVREPEEGPDIYTRIGFWRELLGGSDQVLRCGLEFETRRITIV